MRTTSPNKLKQYRERAGLSQIQVAKSLGFNTNNRISRWEQGIAFPSVINLAKLCKIYNVRTEKIYDNLFK